MVARDPEVDWLPHLRPGIMGYELGYVDVVHPRPNNEEKGEIKMA
jgi:hypothetical protein